MAVERIYYDKIKELEEQLSDMRIALDWYKGAWDNAIGKRQQMPNNLVQWQIQCVCDFENNCGTHSKSCIFRFKVILREMKNTLKEDEGKA